ncbi:MAG: RagB/SusD family nutrient uptake outer membrane protein [Bacteroidales bacterium]|jgi:hypothetical protein|nr:RagB/SusD family nutrient uptake outer membrane protein [Bacteroidales bacterium]
MNKFYKYILTLGLVSVFSCSLETDIYENLTEDKFPENEMQLESVTLGAYAKLTNLLDDWGWWLYMQEVSSDVLVFPQRGTDWEDGGKWRVLNRHTWLSTTMGVQNMWLHIVEGIGKSNQAIEIFKRNEESDVAKMAIAQMQVLRSYYYYLMIDNYGDVPYTEVFATAEKMPYRTKREDIYNRLIEIINESIPYLPDAGTVDNNKISKATAWMLLGKLYLNGHIYKGESSPSAADMDSVIINMNKVISQSYSFETDRLAPFKVENSSSKEIIFSAISDESGSDGLRHNFRTLHTLHQQTYDLQSTPWNGCAIKPDFYEKLFAANDGFDDPDDNTSINDEVVDPRSKAFLRGQQYSQDGQPLIDDNGNFILTQEIKADVMNDATDGAAVTRFSGYRVAKFEIEIGGGPIMNNDFPIFRLPDAYLMRAEATLRGGSGAAATADNDLNTIRNLANLPDVTATLQLVLDERGRELYMEGHRRQDLIRFGQFADRNWWLGATESDPGEKRLVFPLPQNQLNANPNLAEEPIDLVINK